MLWGIRGNNLKMCQFENLKIEHVIIFNNVSVLFNFSCK
jgi:hypothetical protein